MLALATASFCGNCFCQTWDRDRFGNHRAVVRVTAAADAVRVHIPWRHRDEAPEKKSLIVIDGHSGNEIKNVSLIEINREFGDIAFEPASGPGTYYIYYLPYVVGGRTNYPQITYPGRGAKPALTGLAALRPLNFERPTFSRWNRSIISIASRQWRLSPHMMKWRAC